MYFIVGYEDLKKRNLTYEKRVSFIILRHPNKPLLIKIKNPQPHKGRT
jgi:hypothetical protein